MMRIFINSIRNAGNEPRNTLKTRKAASKRIYAMLRQIIFLFILSLATLTGCDPDKIVRDNLSKQTSELYQEYVSGNRNEARYSLQSAAYLLESVKLSPPYHEGQAFTLFLTYGRLFVLEHRASNNDVAQVDLVKARYWALRSVELHGDSPADCNAYLAKFATDDSLMAFIDKWDRGANNGQNPRYVVSP